MSKTIFDSIEGEFDPDFHGPSMEEVIEISDRICYKDLKNYGMFDRFCDILTEGKKSYFWYSLGAAGIPAIIAGSRIDNLPLAAGGLFASLASIGGSSVSASRGDYKSIKEKRISEIGYDEFKELKERL